MILINARALQVEQELRALDDVISQLIASGLSFQELDALKARRAIVAADLGMMLDEAKPIKRRRANKG